MNGTMVHGVIGNGLWKGIDTMDVKGTGLA